MLNIIHNSCEANVSDIYFKTILFDWAALLPANVTKEGGAEIEDIAVPQNTRLMTIDNAIQPFI